MRRLTNIEAAEAIMSHNPSIPKSRALRVITRMRHYYQQAYDYKKNPQVRCHLDFEGIAVILSSGNRGISALVQMAAGYAIKLKTGDNHEKDYFKIGEGIIKQRKKAL